MASRLSALRSSRKILRSLECMAPGSATSALHSASATAPGTQGNPGNTLPIRLTPGPATPFRNPFSSGNFSTAAAPPKPPKIVPPFTAESARAKVQFAEDAWNSKDPERVSLAYTPDSRWRNRTEFFEGREAIKEFLTRKWGKELEYRLMKELWCYTGNKIAVRFEYEWQDHQGQWWRTHGNELWEFDGEGLMQRRDMSANDYEISESERRVKVNKT